MKKYILVLSLVFASSLGMASACFWYEDDLLRTPETVLWICIFLLFVVILLYEFIQYVKNKNTKTLNKGLALVAFVMSVVSLTMIFLRARHDGTHIMTPNKPLEGRAYPKIY